MEKYWYSAIVRRCVDGDTVDLDVLLGFHLVFTERFRLIGINTPEIHGVKKDSREYELGMIAKEWLQNKIEGKEVMVRTYKDKKGKYGRYLVEIYEITAAIRHGEECDSINNEMIEKGLGVAYDGGKR